MRIFLFKIPEKEYNFDEYMNNSDLNYLKHFNGAIRKKKYMVFYFKNLLSN